MNHSHIILIDPKGAEALRHLLDKLIADMDSKIPGYTDEQAEVVRGARALMSGGAYMLDSIVHALESHGSCLLAVGDADEILALHNQSASMPEDPPDPTFN